MSAPLIHTQVDHRDGDDVWFRFTLSQLPAAPGNSHFCLARRIDPHSIEEALWSARAAVTRSWCPTRG